MQILLAEDDNTEQALYFCVRQRRRLSSNLSLSTSISTADSNSDRDASGSTLSTTQTTSATSFQIASCLFPSSWKSLQEQLFGTCIRIQECAGSLWEYSTNLLAASHVDDVWLLRFSILLIAFEYLRQELLECFLLQQHPYYQHDRDSSNRMLFSSSNHSSAFDPSTTASSFTTSELQHQHTAEHLQPVWLIPIFTALVSFTFFLSLMVQIAPGSQAIVLVGMMSLALVECCLVPMALTACTALFWFDVLTAETSLVMLFLVWVTASISSRCIRCALYPSLGHG